MTVEFRVLGPVEVWAGGRPINPGEPRRRAVLAALLVDTGAVVPSTTLIDRVWGDEPPAQAAKTLGTHITRTRRVLEEAADGVDTPAVLSQTGGYRLAVDRDQVDLHRFRRLVHEARDPNHTAEQRVELLRQAIELWRGEPLTGVPGDWADRTRARLVRECLDASAAWAEAELRVGNTAAVLAPLAQLADEYPLVEPLTVMLVRALVAAGRPTEALERCRAHRLRLADDQGTDQGPELRTIYEAIVRGDERPLPAPTTPAGPAAPRPGDPLRLTGQLPPPPPVSASASAEALSPPVRRRPWSRRISFVVRMVGAVGLTIGVVAVATWYNPAVSPSAGPAKTEPSASLPSTTVSDDFSGQMLDLTHWGLYEELRENGSLWSPSRVRVSGGELQIAGVGRNPTGKGNTAGGACWECRDTNPIRRYGVWKARVKVDVGSGYGAIIGLYPRNDDKDGFLTLARIDLGDRRNAYSVMSGSDGVLTHGSTVDDDLTAWNTYSIEWRPESVKMYLNDKVLFDTTTATTPLAIPSGPMYLYFQLVPGPAGPVPAPDESTPSQVVMHVDEVEYTPLA